MGNRGVVLAPTTGGDVPAVAAYLHRALNPRLSPAQWERSIVPPWDFQAPNHGFHLRDEDEVVGAAVAFYADRELGGRTERVCNLAAWCVDDEHRSQGLRLVRALLGQPGYHFTDFSPSGNVVALNERLKFRHLDTTTAVAPNLPRPSAGVRAVTAPDRVRALLAPSERRIFDDHRGARAARHVVMQSRHHSLHVIYRKDRRRGLPVFASVLHVSDPALFPQMWPRLSGHLLSRGVLGTLLEQRVVGWRPVGSVLLSAARPKMFRSDALREDDIDYLYSELTCVAW